MSKMKHKYLDDEGVFPIDLNIIPWKNDISTCLFVEENRDILRFPQFLSPSMLARTATYIESILNPYTVELVRRAGSYSQYLDANRESERAKIIRSAAQSFGIILV